MDGIRRLWERFLAYTGFSPAAVCKLSAGLGWYDYHGLADAILDDTWNGSYKCVRCGKEFLL